MRNVDDHGSFVSDDDDRATVDDERSPEGSVSTEGEEGEELREEEDPGVDDDDEDEEALEDSDLDDSADERSGSETYVTDFGGEVVRDDAQWLEDRVSRSAAVCTYTSSDDSADDEGADEEAAANAEGWAEGWDSSPVVPEEGGMAAQVEAALRRERGARDGGSHEATVDGEAATPSPPRRPRSRARSRPRIQFLDSDTDPDARKQRIVELPSDSAGDAELTSASSLAPSPALYTPRIVSLPDSDAEVDEGSPTSQCAPPFDLVDTQVALLPAAPSCARFAALRARLDSVTSALATMQMITAGCAADAEAALTKTPKDPETLLRGEVVKLRVTVDHLARLTLARAFEVAAEADKHQ